MKGWFRSVGLALVLWGVADAAGARDHAGRDGLLAYLRTALGPPETCAELDVPTTVEIAWADLNGDGRPEALVYVSGRAWCGSGGCELYVLERTGSGFRQRGQVSISKQPIGVLSTRSHGWRDLSVFVSGGGVLQGYSVALPFDGTKYAENPSVPPARPLDSSVHVKNVYASPAAKEAGTLFPLPDKPAPPKDLPEGVIAMVGGRVEVRVPSAFAACWTWVNLTPPDKEGPLRYRTGIIRRDAAGRSWDVWVFEPTGSGE
ncbi:MAG: hypothetical protein ACJ798_02760, partial [Phenylobacterium sp.]